MPWIRTRRASSSVLAGANALLVAGLASAQTHPVQEARLVASDGGLNDRFGYSVDVSGDTAIVGAMGDAGHAGAAYVVSFDGTSWTETHKLVDPAGHASAKLGAASAVDGDTALVGAFESDLAGDRAGTALVYRRSGTDWSIEQRLEPAGLPAVSWFGHAVALEGDTAIVGAPRESNWHGAVYVFKRSGTTWTEEARIVPSSDYVTNGLFGEAVALEGDTLAVGASGDSGGTGAGAVFVFVRSGSTWTQQAKLVAGDAEQHDSLGTAVALRGDRVLAGAPLDDHGGDLNGAGSAYVFRRNGTSWGPEAKLVARDPTQSDQLGRAVTFLGERAVIGAPKDDDACGGGVFCNEGAALLFSRDGTTWSQTGKLTAGDPELRRHVGHALATDADLLLVGTETGAPTEIGPGWAYVFREVASPFASFCSAVDGALASCPCGNEGASDAGCDNHHATGGVFLQATSFLPESTQVQLVGAGFPPNRTPTAVVLRGDHVEPTPVVFGDGLRCVGLSVVRFSGVLALNGTSLHTIGHGVGPGSYHYQLWYRNTPDGYCDPLAGWNLSNGLSIEWP